MVSIHRKSFESRLVVTLALTGAMLAACSKNDSGNNGPPVPAPAPTATAVPTVTTNTPSGVPSGQQLGDAPPGANSGTGANGASGANGSSGANAGSGGNATGHGNVNHQPPPTVGSNNNGNGGGGQNALPPPPSVAIPGTNQNSPPADGSTQGPVPGEIVLDPTGLKPDQIYQSSAQLGEPAVGSQAAFNTPSPVFYTGAGVDDLRDQLTAIALQETNSRQLALNKKFAKEIGMATVEVDWNVRSMKFSVDLGLQGQRANLNFTGQLDNRLHVSGGSLGDKGVTFEAMCMDQNGGCHNVHVRLKRKVAGGTAVAHVITRLSNAYLYIEGNAAGVSHNHEYDNFMNLLLNTVSNRGGPDSVQALAFYTSEVIFGESDFAILMRLGVQEPASPVGNPQMMGLIGPLVKPEGAIDENLIIANPPTEITRIGRHNFLLSNEIANTIREIHLVRDDGRGNLQFDITVRKASANASEDTIRLTVARWQTLTRDPILGAK